MRARAGAGEFEYLLAETARQGARLARAEARRLIRGREERDPSAVRSNYDVLYREIPIGGFDAYVFGDPDAYDHVLIDDHVRWASVQEANREVYGRVVSAVQTYTEGLAEPTVIEFGCGGGRNLLNLKRSSPHLRCIGLDISPEGVMLASRAAERFGLDVEFRVADATTLDGVEPADVCFSVHALEQMPRQFHAVLDTMRASARRAVVLFEPVGELYSSSWRGRLGRMYLREQDYLTGLYTYLREADARVVVAQRLGSASSPLNETVEIHVISA